MLRSGADSPKCSSRHRSVWAYVTNVADRGEPIVQPVGQDREPSRGFVVNVAADSPTNKRLDLDLDGLGLFSAYLAETHRLPATILGDEEDPLMPVRVTSDRCHGSPAFLGWMQLVRSALTRQIGLKPPLDG